MTNTKRSQGFAPNLYGFKLTECEKYCASVRKQDMDTHEWIDIKKHEELLEAARRECYLEAASSFRECGETAVELAYLEKSKLNVGVKDEMV